MAVLLAACSGDAPETTVEAFYKAAAKGDVEAAAEQIYFGNVPAGQMVQAKGKVQMIVGEMQNRVQANGGLDDIEIVDVEVDEATGTATVRSRIKYENGKEQLENHRLLKEEGDWKIRLK